MRSLIYLVLGSLPTLACVGCADVADLGPTGTISGKLTYQGKPLAEGTQVVFMHAVRGFAGLDATDSQGNFEIIFYPKTGMTPEMPIGTYNVTIQPPTGSDASQLGTSEESELADPSANMSPDEMAAQNQTQRFQKTEFPMKYRQASTSGITKEVKEGENSFDIDLK